MWLVNMKIWIVTIICSTVSCRVVGYNSRLSTSLYNNETKISESSSSALCPTCGTNSSISLVPTRGIDELNLFEETLNYVNNKLSIKRETTLLKQYGDEHEQSVAVSPPNAWCEPILQVQKVFRNTVENVEKLVEEHLSCQCGCRVKSNSCMERREYDADECRCDCKDTEEKRNCHNTKLKSWDHNNCRCTCEIGVFRDCNTPLKFNENTCRCEP